MEASKVNEIIKLLQNNNSVRKIAKKYNISHMTVQRIKQKHNIETSNTPGRPRKIDDRTCRHLAKLVTSDNAITPAEALKTLNIDASEWTARRSLKKLGLKAREKKKKPLLSKKNIKLRKEFAQVYENWTVADWEKVMFLKISYFGNNYTVYAILLGYMVR